VTVTTTKEEALFPVCDGNPCVGGDSHRGGNPGNDLEGEIALNKGLGLFPTPAQDKGIASLQADDLLSCLCLLNEEPVDFLLLQGVLTRCLSDIDLLGVGFCLLRMLSSTRRS